MDLFKYRSNWIKCVMVVGSFILHLQTVAAASSDTNSNVCQSEACKNIANSILVKMDRSINPCTNFYEFVCGNFSRNAEISPWRSQNDLIYQLGDAVLNQLRNNIENQITKADPAAFQKLFTYYKTCMDEAQIEKTSNNEFLGILKKLGGWPVLLGKDINFSQFDWKHAINKISKMGYSRNYFLSVEISNDFKNNSRNLLYLDQPAFAISQEYLSQGLKNDVVMAYFNYMIDMAEIFGADRDQATLDLGKSLNFEIELARISMLESKRRDVAKQYNPMKISELQRKYPCLPWLKYLNDHLSPFHRVTKDEVVIVVLPSFFDNLGNLLSRTPKRVLANYMMWRMAFDSADQLDRRVRDVKLRYTAALTGNRNTIPRWQNCIRYASNHLHVATSSLYVRRNFNQASKDGVIDMVEHLRRSFKQILLEVDWMDETTKSAALQKLEQIIPLVGYFDESLDDGKINDYYEDLKLYPKSYLKTVLSYTRFAYVKQLKSYRDPVPRVDWTERHYASHVLNAFYNPTANTIQFPAGILQGDFYNEGFPKYVNYASVGSVIGHEITHGFDDEGCRFDGIGNMVDWWDSDTKEKFLQKTQCIIDQYSNYIDPQVGLYLNGYLTQGENIADTGGLKESYMAYSAYEEKNGEEPILPGFEDFTPRQLFWISYSNVWCAKYRPEHLKNLITTDPHSPNHFRVIGSITNNPYFANDFNCPVGSPMNPEKKCSVW